MSPRAVRVYDLEILNVKDAGAKGDGVTDDLAPIQGLLDAQVGVDDYARRLIYFPPGTYQISKPLRLKDGGIQIAGSGHTCTRIRSSSPFVHGPLLASYPSTTYATVTSRLAASLLSGPGNSYQLAGAGTLRYLNLRDATTLDINGLGAFCVELFYRQTSAQGDVSILQSSGYRYGQEPLVATRGEAFFLQTNSAGKFVGSLRIGGTRYQLTGTTTILNATTYYVALNYDGTTIRLWVNGTVEASQATTGTVTQKPWEDVTLGAGVSLWPESTFGPVADARVDCVRVSDVARNPAVVPSAKYSVDANTLMLLNFDNQYDAFTVGQTKSGDAHLLHRDTAAGNIGPNGDVVIRDLYFDAGFANGILMAYANSSTVERVRVTSNGFGILCWENCFLQRMLAPKVTAKRFGIAGVVAHGVWYLESPELVGGAVQLILQGAGTIVRPWLQTESDTDTAMQLNGDGAHIINPVVSTESGGAALAQAMILNQLGVGVFSGGNIDSEAKPAALVEGGTLTFDTTRFNALGGTPSIFKIAAAPTRRIALLDSYRATPSVPWSDTPNTVSVFADGALGSLAIPEYDAGNSGGALAVNFDNGAKQKITLTAPCTFTFTNPAAGTIYHLRLVQDGTGGRTVSWPGTVKWPGGTVPTPSGANKVDIVSLYYDGTSYYGQGNLNF